MVKIYINNIPKTVNKDLTVLQACHISNEYIPSFCYHDQLSIAGNCRICLVQLENVGKLIESCVVNVRNNLKIYTKSSFILKARENIMEFLLKNHPLDCAICDQGGECDLQEESRLFGSDISRLYDNKRGVFDKNIGPFIQTVMTRCIHCTRCVRFFDEKTDKKFFSCLGRGTQTEIAYYKNNQKPNSYISGNVIDLCPVGALTNKLYRFNSRPWENNVYKFKTNDLYTNSLQKIEISYYDSKIVNVKGIETSNNLSWISDFIRFSFDSLNFYNINSEQILDKKFRDGTKTYYHLGSSFIDYKLLLLLNKSKVNFYSKNYFKEFRYTYINFTHLLLNNKNLDLNESKFLVLINTQIFNLDPVCYTMLKTNSIKHNFKVLILEGLKNKNNLYNLDTNFNFFSLKTDQEILNNFYKYNLFYIFKNNKNYLKKKENNINFFFFFNNNKISFYNFSDLKLFKIIINFNCYSNISNFYSLFESGYLSTNNPLNSCNIEKRTNTSFSNKISFFIQDKYKEKENTRIIFSHFLIKNFFSDYKKYINVNNILFNKSTSLNILPPFLNNNLTVKKTLPIKHFIFEDNITINNNFLVENNKVSDFPVLKSNISLKTYFDSFFYTENNHKIYSFCENNLKFVYSKIFIENLNKYSIKNTNLSLNHKQAMKISNLYQYNNIFNKSSKNFN